MVPITSAGSRSGVNWMREKLILRHSATVFTASVFASPGTPSSRMWPPVRRPISSRSTMTSWPTTRFATSRVMLCASTASFVFAVRVVISETLPLPASRWAPYLVRRVPATPSPPPDPTAPILRSPRPARTACGAAFRRARRISPVLPALPSRRAGRSLSVTQPIPLHLFPAPAAVPKPWSPPRGRVQIRVDHHPPGHGPQGANRVHEMGTLGRRHPRVSQARHHALHDSLVRKRPRHFTDRLLDLGTLDFAERTIEAGDDLGDRANIAQRDHVRCELPQLFDARTLFFRSRRGQQCRDRATGFDIGRQHIRPEHATRATGIHRCGWAPRYWSRSGRRGQRRRRKRRRGRFSDIGRRRGGGGRRYSGRRCRWSLIERARRRQA